MTWSQRNLWPSTVNRAA